MWGLQNFKVTIPHPFSRIQILLEVVYTVSSTSWCYSTRRTVPIYS